MKKSVSLFIVASLLVFSGIALAADKPAGQRLKFEDCDKNNKGSLTFEEAKACWPNLDRKTFDAIDANQDGTITKEKLKANRERHAKAGQKME